MNTTQIIEKALDLMDMPKHLLITKYIEITGGGDRKKLAVTKKKTLVMVIMSSCGYVGHDIPNL